MASKTDLTKAIDDAFQCLLEQKKLGIESQERREEIFKASLKPFFRGRTDEELEEYPFQAVLSIFYENEPNEWKDVDPSKLRAIHAILSLSAKTAHLNLSPVTVSRTQPGIRATNPQKPAIPNTNPSALISHPDPTYNKDDIVCPEVHPSQTFGKALLAALKDLQVIPDKMQEKMRMLRVIEARFNALKADFDDTVDSLDRNQPSEENPEAVKAYLIKLDAKVSRKREEMERTHKALLAITDEVLADLSNLRDGLNDVRLDVMQYETDQLHNPNGTRKELT